MLIEDKLREQGEAIGDEIMAGKRRFEGAVANARETLREADRAVGDLIFRVYQEGGDPKELSRHLAAIQAAEALVKYEKATAARFDKEYHSKAFSLIKKAAKIVEVRAKMEPWRDALRQDPRNPKAKEWLRIYAAQIDDEAKEEVEQFILSATTEADDGNDRR